MAGRPPGAAARARLRPWVAGVGGAWLALLALAVSGRGGTEGDLLIVNARIVDGTGAPARSGSVRVRAGWIVEVGELRPAAGDRVLDAGGLVLAPGFVDTHSHHDRGLEDERDALAAVSQGVTTIVVGQDGGSRFPLSDFFAGLEERPVAVNVASFAGHNTLRLRVMGEDFRREAAPAEVERMARLLRDELAAGALGFATGLEYDPGIYAATSEVLALARVAREAGGRYVSHIRSEDRAFWDAVDELLRIGREAEIPVHISHLKLAMRSSWRQTERLLERLDEARRSGIEVTADVYPYTYWQSTMTVLFPDRDFGDLDAARFAIDEIAPAEGIRIARFDPDPDYVGLTLADVARARGTEPARTLLDLIAESLAAESAGEDGGESIIGESMHEDDVARLLAWEHANVASDGGLRGQHPRGFGAFPRILARFVRERGDLALEAAIHRMSALGARHVGLEDRGVIRPGAAADLVLLDPDRVRDRATPESPHETAVGIERVWVNGVEVYRDGRTTGAFPGRVLRRKHPIDRIFRDFDSPLSPGCAVGVVEDGELTYARGYGMGNLEHVVALGPTSVFRIASVSKQFAAAVMLLLERDGVLSLDDDVRRFLPELPDYGERITVRHLIHHTSGLRDYLTLMALAGKRDRDVYGNEDVVAMLARQRELNFPPGEEHLYSNSGYFLLSQIVPRATGLSLREYAQDRLLAPLGMRRTHFHDDPTRIVPERATGYAPGPDGEYRISMTMLPMVGDGGIFTNIEEMALWERVFVGPVERAGDPELAAYLRARMSDPGVLRNGDTVDYAFGLSHGTHRGVRTIGHGGSFVGYRTHVLRAVDEGLSVTVLCNVATAQPARLAVEVLEVYLEDRLTPPEEAPARQQGRAEEDEPTRLELSADELRRFAGKYRSDELDVVYHLEVEGGRLVLTRPVILARPLEPRRADGFDAGGLAIRFLRDDAGEVAGFLLDAGRVRNLRFSRSHSS